MLVGDLAYEVPGGNARPGFVVCLETVLGNCGLSTLLVLGADTVLGFAWRK